MIIKRKSNFIIHIFIASVVATLIASVCSAFNIDIISERFHELIMMVSIVGIVHFIVVIFVVCFTTVRYPT